MSFAQIRQQLQLENSNTSYLLNWFMTSNHYLSSVCPECGIRTVNTAYPRVRHAYLMRQWEVEIKRPEVTRDEQQAAQCSQGCLDPIPLRTFLEASSGYMRWTSLATLSCLLFVSCNLRPLRCYFPLSYHQGPSRNVTTRRTDSKG